jgi:cytochrome P450
MNALEPKVRDFCARALDPLVGAGRFDFVADLGAQVPMRTIGMLLGVPESDQEEARDRADAALRTEPGQPMDIEHMTIWEGDFFADSLRAIGWGAIGVARTRGARCCRSGSGRRSGRRQG